MGTIMVLYAVAITIVVGATIFTGIDVFLALSAEKTARCRKPGYFNIGYKPEYGTEFCRARLVGKIDRAENKALYLIEMRPEDAAKALYLIEIHPEDAAKARAWVVPEAELRGRHLLEKGKFYRYAFKEELYA